MKTILLAEDDKDLGAMLKQYLELNKFKVIWSKEGEEAIEQFKKNEIDVCILDVMMPKMDGFTLAKKITHYNSEIPFLFLTARKTKEDRIKGLKLGADDYIVKPFEVEELILRVHNIIKRTEKQINNHKKHINQELFQIGNYTFDGTNLELRANDEIFKLTDKEANLISYLYHSKNQLIRREDVLKNIWDNDDFFSGRSMDVFISRIRKYFKYDESISIKTTRGVGLEFCIKDYH